MSYRTCKINRGRKSFLSSSFIVFLISFFNRMVIRIIGEFSPTFVFSVLTIPFWISELDFKKDKVLNYFTKFFLILIALNIIWMPFSHVETIKLIKSLASPINGLLVFLYLYYAYTRNPNSIKWAILGGFLSTFFFQGELVENFGLLAGTYEYYKFMIFPRIVSGIITIYVLIKWRWFRTNFAWIFIFIGLVGFATGARSSGLIPFIAGVATLIMQRRSTSLKHFKTYVIVAVIVLYGAYAGIYVPNVLNGNINSGNSEQLLHADNPYNPINLLMVGRSDSVVPFLAFLDKPLFGWGTAAMDTPDYKYTLLAAGLSETDHDPLSLLNVTQGMIPGHSSWGIYACYYGILGFLAFWFMMVRFWKLTTSAVKTKGKDTLLILYLALGWTWNILFSPGTIKIETGTLAMALALIVITLRIPQTKQNQNTYGK